MLSRSENQTHLTMVQIFCQAGQDVTMGRSAKGGDRDSIEQIGWRLDVTLWDL